MGARRLFAVMAGVILLAATLAAIWFSVSNQTEGDATSRVYRRFCRKAARAGVARAETEGPSAFAQRLAERFPGGAESIRAFAEEYLRRRYGRADKGGPGALQSRLKMVVLRRE